MRICQPRYTSTVASGRHESCAPQGGGPSARRTAQHKEPALAFLSRLQPLLFDPSQNERARKLVPQGAH
eukprot:2346163-Pyramimonas_sp.AAC.1